VFLAYTVRFWPIRKARSIACKSLAGSARQHNILSLRVRVRTPGRIEDDHFVGLASARSRHRPAVADSSEIQPDASSQGTDQQDVLVLSGILEPIDHVHPRVYIHFARDHTVVESVHCTQLASAPWANCSLVMVMKCSTILRSLTEFEKIRTALSVCYRE